MSKALAFFGSWNQSPPFFSVQHQLENSLEPRLLVVGPKLIRLLAPKTEVVLNLIFWDIFSIDALFVHSLPQEEISRFTYYCIKYFTLLKTKKFHFLKCELLTTCLHSFLATENSMWMNPTRYSISSIKILSVDNTKRRYLKQNM
jgi:hypothetical protein